MSFGLRVASSSTFRFWVSVISAANLMASALLQPPVGNGSGQTLRTARSFGIHARPDARRIRLNPFRLQTNQQQDLLSVRHRQKLDKDPPRMFVATGCDGSTAILSHAINILAIHGIDAGSPHAPKEMLYQNNPYMTEENDDIVTAMQLLKKDRKAKNQTLVFKSILYRDMNATVSRGLVDLGTRAVFNTRRNALDKLVCMIRDCFVDTSSKNTTFGLTVDKDGVPSQLCFGRRDLEGPSHLKTWVRTDTLAANLAQLEEKETQGLEILRKAGYNPLHTHYEDVVAFERGGKGDIETSSKAWSKILASWEVPVMENELREYLKSQAGTFSPSGQWEVIYNMKGVSDELMKLGRTDLLHVLPKK